MIGARSKTGPNILARLRRRLLFKCLRQKVFLYAENTRQGLEKDGLRLRQLAKPRDRLAFHRQNVHNGRRTRRAGASSTRGDSSPERSAATNHVWLFRNEAGGTGSRQRVQTAIDLQSREQSASICTRRLAAFAVV